ncbi:hypothetical protein NPIL_550811 [Nephila pilipes]|uniref:Uncharacterized protein n=1 Tax=Nephila pilipes TaxID=299642 RepID=A0A8X6QFI3_NEPPI|nr:hypothetical protein NPIL_550811 [Nephila pilipes]
MSVIDQPSPGMVSKINGSAILAVKPEERSCPKNQFPCQMLFSVFSRILYIWLFLRAELMDDSCYCKPSTKGPLKGLDPTYMFVKGVEVVRLEGVS